MAGREVNCEYCRVVVFEADRWCIGCGAPRLAFPDEAPVVYEKVQPYISPTSEPTWGMVCSTAMNMTMCDSSTPYMFDPPVIIRGVEYST